MCGSVQIPDFERKKETLYQCLSIAGATGYYHFQRQMLHPAENAQDEPSSLQPPGGAKTFSRSA